MTRFHKPYSPLEIRIVCDLSPYWSSVLISRALSRPARSVEHALSNRGIHYGGHGRHRRHFWPTWRRYVHDNWRALYDLARHIVVHPRTDQLHCDTCYRLPICSSTEVLQCEDMTLWDCVEHYATDSIEQCILGRTIIGGEEPCVICKKYTAKYNCEKCGDKYGRYCGYCLRHGNGICPVCRRFA